MPGKELSETANIAVSSLCVLTAGGHSVLAQGHDSTVEYVAAELDSHLCVGGDSEMNYL